MSAEDLASFVVEPAAAEGTPAGGMEAFAAPTDAYAAPDMMGMMAGGGGGELMGGDMAAAPPAAYAPPAAAPAAADDPFSGVPVAQQDAAGAYVIPEQTALREWEDKHEEHLEEKMRKEEADKKEKRAQGAADLAAWYEERKANLEKRKASNRMEEEAVVQARADAMKPGANPWERIVDLIDTNAQPGAADIRDTTRMRSLLISLKSNPPAAAPVGAF